MATGREMLAAVRQAIARAPERKALRLSTFDFYDLLKLDRDALLDEFDIDRQMAATVADDLANDGSLVKLGELLGVELLKDKNQKNLIPGEGIRRSAGVLATDVPMTADEIAEEIERMRYPEMHP